MQDVQQELSIWTIFHNPIDFPRKFVVRRFIMVDVGAFPTPDHSVHDTLDQARDAVPQGKVCISRNDEDEPQVVESWV